jgi:hypothetical protein
MASKAHLTQPAKQAEETILTTRLQLILYNESLF